MEILSKVETPHALPLNSKQPNDIHVCLTHPFRLLTLIAILQAVSSSLPTWSSVEGAANYEDRIMDTLEVDYPRWL